MIKFGVSVWLILTIILFAFPIGWLAYFIFGKLRKYFMFFYSSVFKFRELYKIKNDILIGGLSKSEDGSNVENKFSSIAKDSSDKTMPLFNAEDLLKNNGKLDKETNSKKKKMLEKIIYEALVLRKEGKLEQYEKKIIEGLALQPNDRDLNKLLADFYFSIGNHKKALSLLKKIIESDPHDHKAIRQIGEIYLMTGDFETAELLLEKAIHLNPSNPKYFMSIVELYYNTDRKREAISVMEKVIKLRPTVSSYLMTLADLYNEVGDLDNAKKNYFRVLEYEPNSEKAKKKLKNLSAM